MKTSTCINFLDALTALNEHNIKSLSELKLEENQTLYVNTWLAVQEFCHFALQSKTTKSKTIDKVFPGNYYKVKKLISCGLTTWEDIESDCMVKIMSILDSALRQETVAKQYNYCYTTINYYMFDRLRLLKPYDHNTISIDEPIKSKSVSMEDTCTYLDIIPDNTYNAALTVEATETIRELKEIKSQQILHEITVLSKRPPEVIAQLGCTHLRLKPRKLAAMINDYGINEAFLTIVNDIAEDDTNNLTKNDLITALTSNINLDDSTLSDIQEQISDSKQVSRLIYRSHKRLS